MLKRRFRIGWKGVLRKLCAGVFGVLVQDDTRK